MKENLEEIVEPLIQWYKKSYRKLPWREDKNPYHIWLSEIMLQQTKIEAAKKYYERFIKGIPTIKDLAYCEEEKLLKLWEGLGYYNRARNLKKAALIIEENFKGQMPKNYENLLILPGIGEYTAGAIASIAYDEKVVAVDGNVLRVLSRILASRKDVLLPKTKVEMTEKLKNVIPTESGIFNQALMELGEIICIPNGKPICKDCPIKDKCKAYQQGLTEELPIREKIVKRKKENITIFLLFFKDKIAIQKRKEKGLLSGMYEFPNVDYFVKQEQIEEILKNWNLESKTIKKLIKSKHVFSHIEWEMQGYPIEVKNKNEKFLWVTKEKLEEKYPVPSAFQAFQKIIE